MRFRVWGTLLVLLAFGMTGCASLISSAQWGAQKSTDYVPLLIDVWLPVINKGLDAGERGNDVKMMKEGGPIALVAIDTLISYNASRGHGSYELYVLASSLNTRYANFFIEAEDPEWASLLYAKSRDYGLQALLMAPKFKKAVERDGEANLKKLTLAEYREALDLLGPKNTDALFWTARAWAGWMFLNSQKPEALDDIPHIMATMERVQELDHTYYNGSVHIFFGIYYAWLPESKGRDWEKARQEFETAIELSKGKYLANKLAYAYYYAVPRKDEKLFDTLIAEILATPANAIPERNLSNESAKYKARILMAKKKELFSQP